MFSLVFGRDTVHLQVHHTRNREGEKRSGQTNLFNIWRTGAMDRTPVALIQKPQVTPWKPKVKLSLCIKQYSVFL
jgi:hypothetical protein